MPPQFIFVVSPHLSDDRVSHPGCFRTMPLRNHNVAVTFPAARLPMSARLSCGKTLPDGLKNYRNVKLPDLTETVQIPHSHYNNAGRNGYNYETKYSHIEINPKRPPLTISGSHRRPERRVGEVTMKVVLSAKLIKVAAAAMAGLALVFGAGAAQASNAKLVAEVSMSTQTMSISIDGRPAYVWKVSTARQGLRDADRHVQADPHAQDVVLAQIRQCADAAFGLLQRRLCGTWDRRTSSGSAGPHRMAACGCIPPTRPTSTSWSRPSVRTNTSIVITR